ncbi:MAG TPA: hypothetical protein VGC90_00555 [Candidatus Limnocylindrales bacterium]
MDDDSAKQGLPEHEYDDPNTVGAGVMSQGGTSTDRGTGAVDSGDHGTDDEHDATDYDSDDLVHGELTDRLGPGPAIVPGQPAGGTQPYTAGLIGEDTNPDGGGD